MFNKNVIKKIWNKLSEEQNFLPKSECVVLDWDTFTGSHCHSYRRKQKKLIIIASSLQSEPKN